MTASANKRLKGNILENPAHHKKALSTLGQVFELFGTPYVKNKLSGTIIESVANSFKKTLFE